MRLDSTQNLKYKSTTFLLCFGLVLLLNFTVIAERLPVKTYTVADGLLRDTAYKIKQDSRGFLWFCTQEGVSRFDGYAFTNFTVADGLPDRHVNDFLEAKDGTIFIATDGGLARLNPSGIRLPFDESKQIRNPQSNIQHPTSLFIVYLPDNERAKKVTVLFEDESGGIFVGTSDGLYELANRNGQTKLELVNLGEPTSGEDRLGIAAIAKDRRGAIWIGTLESGLFRILPDGAVEHFGIAHGLPDVNVSVIREDKNGRLWVGLRPNKVAGLVLLVAEPQKNQTIVERHYTTKKGLPADWITDLFESSDGKFWVATTGGLCEWQGGETSVCKTYTKENGLCDGDVWSITEDKDNNLWVGSKCGAKKWTRYGFTTYREADGMGGQIPNSIFETAAGELFVSFSTGTARPVSRFDGEQFELIKPIFSIENSYSGWGWKQTVWQDRAGDWWFPSGRGINRFPHPARAADLPKITAQEIIVGTKQTEVFRFYEDSRGDFWFSTLGNVYELWRWQRSTDTWSNFTRELGIGKYRIVSAFVEDKAGNLWIGTGTDTNDAALIRYRDGQFKVFPQAENPLLAGWMRDLFVDGRGRLWIADSSTGLLRLDDVNSGQLNFTQYTTAEGLSSIGVSCVTEDAFGRIYIGTGRGLDRLNPDTGQIENFTTADGLPNSKVEIAYRDRQNNLWFGTNDGLARLVPEPERPRQPPNVLITGLRVSGVPQAVSILGEIAIPELNLAADQRQVTIDFLGLGASLGERLKYEYRLGESDWTQTNERTVNFANLASGAYQFEVRAQTADRIYSQPASVSFRIAAPLWQRWWFILGVLILTGSVFYWFYRFRLIKLLEIERTRTRIATDLHDDIGTNLSKIALLSEIVNMQLADGNKEHNRLLNTIAETSRESVAAMSDIVWTISPKSDSMLEMTRRMRQHAEEIFVEKNVRVKFNAPDNSKNTRLSMDMRREIYLIFKEAVNNASKHAACSNVEIDFQANGNECFLRVSDDGHGFDDNLKSDGNGLQNMKMRAEKMNANLEIESGKERGTIISVRFHQN